MDNLRHSLAIKQSLEVTTTRPANLEKTANCSLLSPPETCPARKAEYVVTPKLPGLGRQKRHNLQVPADFTMSHCLFIGMPSLMQSVLSVES